MFGDIDDYDVIGEFGGGCVGGYFCYVDGFLVGGYRLFLVVRLVVECVFVL